MVIIGKSYDLEVTKTVDFGVYLAAGDLGEVLLPRRHINNTLRKGDTVHVFLYLDSEDRPVATTQTPKACVGEFAYLPMVASTDVGAFLNWGLDKDVLVPFSEQHRPLEVGKSYLVFLYIDKVDQRITASSKIDKYIDDDEPHEFEPQQAVDLIIGNSTELGYKVIINHRHWGILYKDEVHQRISFGQSLTGFIKTIRADGKIDLSLRNPEVSGYEIRDKHAIIILDYLKSNQGFAPLHDKSDPKQIAETFGMSKGAFKKAIGGLYKKKVIAIEKQGIRLIEE
ncbi:MAG: GntR family transcriptional regulator [Gammaproteobacteria bacterium]|nr:GntR family transcriptional regulator [Gammaproteobacteria bacterium]